MKRNYFQNNITSIKKLFLSVSVAGSAILVMSFGPLFFGPGLTTPEPFTEFSNNNFPGIGAVQNPYQPAYPNVFFDSPITFTLVPNQNKIVIGQLDGKVFYIDDDPTVAVKHPIVDLSDEVGDYTNGEVWDGGFLGLSIHPEFGTTPGKNYFFIYYTTSEPNNTLGTNQPFSCDLENFAGNYLKLERFQVDPVTMQFVEGSRENMINREMYNTTHRGGGMDFGEDGYLYLSTGDQASYTSAQIINDNLDGGVLRIDVDMLGAPFSHAPRRFLQDPGVGNTHPDSEGLEISGNFYYIPDTNPFNDINGSVFEEYFTIGHRNPHRMTKDADTGIFYIGEIGEGYHEEINILSSGKNYGWPLFEGMGPGPDPDCVTELYNNMEHEQPLMEFPRVEANALIGGYVYRGSDIPSLDGKYICADYGTGEEIWAVDITNGTYQVLGNFGPADIISFGQGVDNELYLMKLGNNVNLFKLTTPGIDYSSMPQTLTATGAFTDVPNLEVSEGFLPYELIDPFWSDGADKKRWMAIPNDGSHNTPQEQIIFSENGAWEFPVGTVLIKHFDYPIDDTNPNITRKVETRFSIKANDGTFYFLTYNWNDEQTEAYLQEVGLDEPIQITEVGGGTRQVDWHFPSNSECLSCHNAASTGTLGLRTRYLNSDYDYSTHAPGGQEGNQLVTLSYLNILDEDITDADTPDYLTHTSINDPTADIDDKARSYLDLNCAYCHRPGTGNRGDFDLRLFNTLAQTGLLSAEYNTPIGIQGEEIVLAGDASKSQLYHRTASADPSIMMPPLAKSQVDAEGAALIEEWINQLQPLTPAPDPGAYRIVNRASGETLQVADASMADMANISESGYNGFDNQHFILENVFSGYYQLRASHSDKYLDVAEASTAAGANIWQYEGNGTDAQLWEILDAGDGTFFFVSKLSGYYMGTQLNGNVVVNNNDGSDIYRWEFLEPSNPLGLGITVEQEPLVTSEDGTSDEMSVVLNSAPSSDVVLLINGLNNTDEYVLSTTEITFTNANWDVPQIVTITGEDDFDVDGVQYYTIEITVDDTRSDPMYTGFSAAIEGYNSDDDGGSVGPPVLGVYRIINHESGETLQVPDGSLQNFANITEFGYQGLDNQHVELEYEGNNLYRLRFLHSNKYLDVAEGSTQVGANIWQYEDNGGDTDAQLWQIIDAGDGTFYLVSEAGGHYLGTEPNGNVFVQLNDSSDTIRWRFTEPSEPFVVGLTVEPGLVAVSEDGQTDIISVVLDGPPSEDVVVTLIGLNNTDEFNLSFGELTFTDTNWDIPQEVIISGVDESEVDGVQYFDIEIAVDETRSDPAYFGFSTIIEGYNSDDDGGGVGAPSVGTYRILNRASGETLQVPDASLLDMANIAEDTYDNLDNQHFELEYTGNNLYALRVLHSNKYLDVSAASLEDGANIWQYAGNGSDAQLWQIVDAGDGTFHLISELSGYYLGTEPDGNVVVQSDNGSDSIRWEFRYTGYPPNAVATSDVTEGEAPLEVSFTGDGSSDDVGITGYLWDFGDGNTATEANPVHTFTVAGTYEVSLTVTDAGGLSDEATLTITVSAANGTPNAVATSDVTEGEAPLEVSFTGDGSSDDVGITGYLWDFGDGNTSAEANPVHTFTIAGTYEVSLTVTDAGGLSDEATLTITVSAANGTPTAVATSDVTEGGAPLEVSFTGDGSSDDVGITGYLWDFGDGNTSAEANPVHTFTVAGTYEVSLTVTDSGGLSDEAILTITVSAANGTPNAVATSDVTEGGAPLEVSFTGDGSSDDVGITGYLWDFGDGNTSAEANPVHTFTVAGTYEVSLTVTDSGGLSDEAILTITVSAANGTPNAVATSDVTEGEAPLEVSFTGDGSSDDVGITGYLWDFGDGNTATEANPVHTFTVAGTYEVSLTVTDAGGLSDEATLTITVSAANGTPNAVATSDVTEGEAPLEVSFTGDGSSDDVGITGYLWDFGDGNTATEANPVHTFTVAGTYEVSLTVTNAGGLSDEAILTITVTAANGTPTAVATSDVTEGEAPLVVSFTGDGSSDDVEITGYLWDFGDGNTATEANPVHTFTVAGTYEVSLTVTDAGGLSDVASLTIEVIDNETNTLEEIEVIVAPNPTSEYAYVYMNNSYDRNMVIGFTVHDTSGRLINLFMEAEVYSEQGVYKIPMYGLRDEAYAITITFTNFDPISKRVIVRN